MKITTTARHCELENGLRSHAEKRLEKLSKFSLDIIEAHLVVTAEKFRYLAEITLRLSGPDLVSREEADQPQIAIDLTIDHLEEQLRRTKERRVTDRRGGRARAETLAIKRKAPEAGDDESADRPAGTRED